MCAKLSIKIMCVLYCTCFLVLQSSFPQCREIVKNFSGGNPGNPVVIGDAFFVPKICLRIIDRTTEKEIQSVSVRMFYMWKYWLFPYSETRNGAWDYAHDIIACVTDKNGLVQFPKYTVIPVGWYDGQYLKNRKPEFYELEIRVMHKDEATFWITKKQIEQIRNKKIKKSIELKRPDGYIGSIKVEIISCGG